MSTLRERSFVVVTGASRGIGRATAVQLAGKIHPKSIMILIARSLQALEETAGAIKRDVDEELDVRCIVADFSDTESVNLLTKSFFGDVVDIKRFDHVIVIHSAAGGGEAKYLARELDDVESMQSTVLLNLTAPIAITSKVFHMFRNGNTGLRKTVVQVTSSSATYPQKTLHLYGAMKAGRDMFFRVMALEEPEVRILTYDPGLVDTKMFSAMLNFSKDPDLRKTAEYFSKQSYFLTPEQSADSLMKALEEDKYESGVTIRCYDVMNIDTDDIVRHLTHVK